MSSYFGTDPSFAIEDGKVWTDKSVNAEGGWNVFYNALRTGAAVCCNHFKPGAGISKHGRCCADSGCYRVYGTESAEDGKKRSEAMV